MHKGHIHVDPLWNLRCYVTQASNINDIHTNIHNWCKSHEKIMKNDRDMVVYAYTVILHPTSFYMFIVIKI